MHADKTSTSNNDTPIQKFHHATNNLGEHVNVKTNLRRLSTAAALAGALLVGAATTSAQTVTAVMQSGLRVTDPVVTTATLTHYHGYMIYDTLLGMDAAFNIRPQMADWQASEDGKTYVLTLRDGLKWHDGAPVTAEDCVASIQRWGRVDTTGQVLMSMIEHIKTLDDQRFEIQLKEPTSLLLQGLAQLSNRALFMMPKRIAETPPTTPLTEYVGSGPFKFVAKEFQPGLKAVYEKNTDYVPRNEPPSWTAGGKVVHVDRVEWVSMPDVMTAVNALQNEEIDYIELLPLDMLPLVQNNRDIRVHVLSELGTWSFMRMNHLHPPFNNKRLRQAAMTAVAQEDVMKALVGNPDYYRTCAAVLGCGNLLADTYGEDWIVPGNIANAQALLKEANYDGTPVVILQPTDISTLTAQPIVIGAALRRAGFNVEMKAMDWQTALTQRTNQKSVAEGGWSIFSTNNSLATSGNPITNYTVAAAGRASWPGWPDVPEIEVLRAKFARTADPAEIKAIATRIQQLVIDEGVVMPLGQFLRPSAYRTTLRDVLESPVAVFWNLKKFQ